MEKEKKFELDRLFFFSDAVVAIAITLLAFNLKLNGPSLKTLHFTDIFHLWREFLAFFLSFMLIAAFWRIHHQFFQLVQRMSEILFWYNMGWLMSIVLVPFSTILISEHFRQVAPMVVYSANILLITIFQNQIWDYIAVRPEFLNDFATPDITRSYRIMCNVAMFNALVALLVSFVLPLLGFLVLFCRPMMMKIIKFFSSKPKSSPTLKA